VLHGHDDAAGSGDQVHSAAHSFDHFTGNHPVGDRAFAINLHGAQNCKVNVTAADHGKTISTGKKGGAFDCSDRLFSSVDQIRIDLIFQRKRTESKESIFTL
jgi:hypothetical protein